MLLVIIGLVVITLSLLHIPFAALWASWLVIVDLIPTVGGALAAIPIVLFAVSHSLTAGIVTFVVCATYIELELHVLAPVITSKTMRVSATLTFLAVLIGVSVGNLIDGPFGGFAAALLAVPTAGALQIVAREIWMSTAPPPGPGPFAQPASAPSSGTERMDIADSSLDGR
jgi:predicted PurR-regulated permease PerM